jgi:hypothetical protein
MMATAASQAAAATPEVSRPVATASVATAPKAAVAAAQQATNPYPYITSELRRIAVIDGIVIVILIILAVVFT